MEGVKKVHIDLDRFKPARAVKSVEREEPLNAKLNKIIPAPKIRPYAEKASKELAYCRSCRTDRPMLWKPPRSRGKSVDSWFVCAECGGDDLKFKYLSYDEAVEKNRCNGNDDPVPF